MLCEHRPGAVDGGGGSATFKQPVKKKCAPFGFAGFFDVRVVWVQAWRSATGVNALGFLFLVFRPVVNLIRGGRFAPSLELKPLVSIEVHPPTLHSLSQGWLEDADALLCTSSLGLGTPALAPLRAVPAVLPRRTSVGTLATLCACAAKARTRLSGAFSSFTGGQCFLLLQVHRVPWRQCNFQATREKEVRAFWICGVL